MNIITDIEVVFPLGDFAELANNLELQIDEYIESARDLFHAAVADEINRDYPFAVVAVREGRSAAYTHLVSWEGDVDDHDAADDDIRRAVDDAVARVVNTGNFWGQS